MVLATAAGSGVISETAGAAEPMMTTLAAVPLEVTGWAAAGPSLGNSALGVFLRAESAAKGDGKLDRAGAGGSARRTSADEARTGLAVVRGPAAGAEASLRSCSIGS